MFCVTIKHIINLLFLVIGFKHLAAKCKVLKWSPRMWEPLPLTRGSFLPGRFLSPSHSAQGRPLSGPPRHTTPRQTMRRHATPYHAAPCQRQRDLQRQSHATPRATTPHRTTTLKRSKMDLMRHFVSICVCLCLSRKRTSAMVALSTDESLFEVWYFTDFSRTSQRQMPFLLPVSWWFPFSFLRREGVSLLLLENG